VCRRKYTPAPKVQGYSEAVKQAAVRQAVDGGNYRRIGRALGVDHQTVANWVKARSETVPDAPPTPEGELVVNELDEVFTFVGAKKTKSTS
jgi:transposase-like protein